MPKIAFKTLGCKLNFSETSALKQNFHHKGYEITSFDNRADIYVINTCSVTENANADCRKYIRAAQRRAPNSRIVVTGCYAQLKPNEVASLKGVHYVVGNDFKSQLSDMIPLVDSTYENKPKIFHNPVEKHTAFDSAISTEDRTRTFLKIQDGCNYKCSFCTIPMARGQSRSATISHIVNQVKDILNKGYKEIVLTGVNTGDFGRLQGESLLDLLWALENIPSSYRIRLSSIEPNLLHNDIIQFIAQSDKFLPHFHIPLQSGSNDILKLMRRRYNVEIYTQKIEVIRKWLPDACIGVDVIAGHPGESVEHFEESYHFLNTLDISYLHVFTYSERSNTAALDIKPIIPYHERKRRTRRYRELSCHKRYNFNKQFIGTERLVLFEKQTKHKHNMYGWTDNYIRVCVPYDELLSGKIISVKLESLNSESIFLGNVMASEVEL